MLFQRFADNDLFGSLRDMQRLQDSLNRTLSASAANNAPEFPPINVWTSESGALVRAEIPGIAPEDVDISLMHDTLTIRGSRQAEDLKGASRHRHERGHGQFTRSLQLPFGVDADKVQAKFSNGVLQITLPRAEAEKPRRITVVSES